MIQNEDEVRGHMIVLLVEGDILPAQSIKATHKGMEIKSGSIATTVDPLSLSSILEVKPTQTFTDLLDAQEKFTKDALSRTLCGVLEIEELTKAYARDTGLKPNSLKIIIFGSGSLSLTILPKRVSHDVDAAVPSQFMAFCEQKMRKSHGAKPEFSSPRLLQDLGAWEERASTIEGLSHTTFLIPHPLDTVMQKLLRTDATRFETNDKPDIRDILERLNPDKETLIGLLTENPARYRIPKDKEQAQAIVRNTNWFTKEFLPEHNAQSIAKLADETEEELLEKGGYIPSISIRVAPQKNRRLKDLLHPKDPPGTER